MVRKEVEDPSEVSLKAVALRRLCLLSGLKFWAV